MDQQLQRVLRYLEENKLKLCCAESCTVGLIATKLGDYPGAGKWLECAFVTYSEGSKLAYLQVKPETIERFNLTSEEVAREMAEGALKISAANIALSTTGVAGPDPGEGNIPAGTVCFAWAFERGKDNVVTFSETRRFDGDRNTVRKAAADYAITRIAHYHEQLNAQRAHQGAPAS